MSKQMTAPSESVSIELSLSEALVLDAMLWRWEERHMPSALQLEHQGEWTAIWSLQTELQRELERHLITVHAPPNDGQYDSKLTIARQSLGQGVGDWVDVVTPGLGKDEVQPTASRSWFRRLVSR